MTPIGGADGGPTGAKTLKEWVGEWASFDERLKELKGLIESAGDPASPDYDPSVTGLSDLLAEQEELKAKRRALADSIVSAVNSKPKLWDVAVTSGFNEDILDARADTDEPDEGGDGGTGGSGDGGNNGDQPNDDNQNGSGGDGGNNDQNDNQNNDNGGPGHNQLPGTVGKDFKVYKASNGRYYVVWSEGIPGTKDVLRWQYTIDEQDLKGGKYGVSMKDVDKRVLTKADIRRGNFFHFGNVDEIKRGIGGDRHPGRKFLKLLIEQHPNASWLGERDVLRIMMQAKIEGRGSEWTNNMLRQTPWWNSLTDNERAWEETSEAEQAKQVQEQTSGLTAQLDQAFGPNVGWKDTIGGDKLERWAVALASGRISQATMAERINSIAQQVEGTNAWVGQGEQAQTLANSLAHYDNALIWAKDQALEWMGPHASPDNAWLSNQAKRIATGDLGQDQFVADLQAKARGMHRWLGEGESWTSRATSYKSLFENLTGSTIGYDDNALRNLTARKDDGTAIPDQIMSLDDYERYIRLNDERWRTSDNFTNERSGLRNLIQQTFTGVGGGF